MHMEWASQKQQHALVVCVFCGVGRRGSDGSMAANHNDTVNDDRIDIGGLLENHRSVLHPAAN